MRRGPRLRVSALVDTLMEIESALGFAGYDLGLLVTNDRRMASYHRDLLGKRGPTDVISVPNMEFVAPKVLKDSRVAEHWGEKDLGDIVVSLPYVIRKANEENVDPSKHLVKKKVARE